MRKYKILITTGGTGGHIFPALALKKKLEESGYDVVVTADAKFIKYHPFDENHILVPSASFASKSLFKLFFTMFTLASGLFKSLKVILQTNPQLVIGFGGYASFPTLVAAAILNKKIILHEANTVIGKANRLMLWKASYLTTGFKKIIGVNNKYLFKVVYTGNPVRSEILSLKKESISKKIVILIIGGSQGAKVFSSIIPEALQKLDEKTKSKLLVYQQVRKEDVEELIKVYDKEKIECEIKPFFDDMQERLVKASFLISRAGASTIAELIATQTPSILIPYPSAADNHQYYNAKEIENAKASWLVIEEPQITNKLLKTINEIIQNPEIIEEYSTNLVKMKMDSSEKIIQLIKKI